MYADDKDLIYEGIATLFLKVFRLHVERRQRPDLRRDCDVSYAEDFVLGRSDDKDLIYEGIATPRCC